MFRGFYTVKVCVVCVCKQRTATKYEYDNENALGNNELTIF